MKGWVRSKCLPQQLIMLLNIVNHLKNDLFKLLFRYKSPLFRKFIFNNVIGQSLTVGCNTPARRTKRILLSFGVRVVIKGHLLLFAVRCLQWISNHEFLVDVYISQGRLRLNSLSLSISSCTRLNVDHIEHHVLHLSLHHTLSL